MVQGLKDKFEQVFGEREEMRYYFSPGRINLIGEHIDYNGGVVFPAAITLGTFAAVSPREDKQVNLYSGNFASVGVVSFDVADLGRKEDEPWTVYAKGVMDVYQKAGYPVDKGFDGYIEGNIPNGSGLSSSASLEVLIGLILADLNRFSITGAQNALLAQKAENEYVGVNCGIMDQFAIAMGKEAKALMLNTDTLDYTYADCDLGAYQILIMNTNKRRELADSKYNERRAECDAALGLLKQVVDIAHLCDLTVDKFDEVKHVLTEENLLKRTRHAVTENARVKAAVAALSVNDLIGFGALLNASHDSLRTDYEVTGMELDAIVDGARSLAGVLGARMTGAGFGGCAIALVHEDALETVKNQVAIMYEKAVGYLPDFYVASIGDGAKKIQEV